MIIYSRFSFFIKSYLYCRYQIRRSTCVTPLSTHCHEFPAISTTVLTKRSLIEELIIRILLHCSLILFNNILFVTSNKVGDSISKSENDMKMLPNIATEAHVAFYIKDLFDISSVSMEYKLNYYYYLEWSDSRLVFNASDFPDGDTSLELDSLENHDIFIPNVLIQNAKVNNLGSRICITFCTLCPF